MITVFSIFSSSCQKENATSENVIDEGVFAENRTEEAACGDEDVEGCLMKPISTTFTYQGCDYLVYTTYFICPNKIVMNPIGFTRGVSGPCLDLVREATDLYLTPFVGTELASDFWRNIVSNLSIQMRNHIINTLDPSLVGNYRCNQDNPCSNPTTVKTFVGLTKDCFTYCVEGWDPDPDNEEVMLVNLTREQCGENGCCKSTTPFCIENGVACYGTTVKEVVTECTALNPAPCENSCPTVCNN
jgi:hypothetical protein